MGDKNNNHKKTILWLVEIYSKRCVYAEMGKELAKRLQKSQ